MQTRLVILLIFIFFLNSCENAVEERIIEFPFGIGQVKFENHLGFDWEFEWVDFSDMVYLEERKQRFAKSTYEPLCQSGFLYANHADSVFQMTLSSYTQNACNTNSVLEFRIFSSL